MNCVREAEKQHPFFSEPDAKIDSGGSDLIQICIPTHLAYIAIARNAVDTVAEQLKMSADSRSALKLAVGEACNNAVQYGHIQNSDAGTGKVYVACRVLPHVLEVEVMNQSTGFSANPGNHTMPPAEALAESGRGLALIEMLMDSVEYRSTDRHFLVRLQKRF